MTKQFRDQTHPAPGFHLKMGILRPSAKLALRAGPATLQPALQEMLEPSVISASFYYLPSFQFGVLDELIFVQTSNA